MTQFRPGQSANEAHAALKSAVQTMENAQQCAVLWFGDILARKLYRQLGYSSINQYAKVELGFSKSRTGDFLQLCRKLEKLPKVKRKVASGELGYTAARVLVNVTDQSNEEVWLDYAMNNSRRDLEKEVKLAKQEAAAKATCQPSLMPVKKRPAAVVPVRVGLQMSPTQFARYEALWEQIRKQGNMPAGKVEALLEIMGTFAAGRSPRGDLPVQIHIHQCPDCEQATVQTGKGELEVGIPELERAQCDCRISRPGQRNTTTIPPAVRRKVLARDRHRCQRPGCGHTRFLEVHHKTPRSRGGTNDPGNLVSLCSGCHQLLHEKRTGFVVKSPPGIYVYGKNGPNEPHPGNRSIGMAAASHLVYNR